MSTRLQSAALVVTLMGSLTLLGTPSFAVEPDRLAGRPRASGSAN